MMSGTKAVRQQYLYGSPEQFVTLIAELSLDSRLTKRITRFDRPSSMPCGAESTTVRKRSSTFLRHSRRAYPTNRTARPESSRCVSLPSGRTAAQLLRNGDETQGFGFSTITLLSISVWTRSRSSEWTRLSLEQTSHSVWRALLHPTGYKVDPMRRTRQSRDPHSSYRVGFREPW